MTLAQLHDVRLWHLRHWRDAPVERQVWDLVLTFWLIGWVGTPAAVLVHMAWGVVAGTGLVFLPAAYVGVRARLHSARRLRCDWIVALR